MLDAYPLKESFAGDGGVSWGRDKTEARMELEMWVYMVVRMGGEWGWAKINKSDSLYLSA